MNQEGSVDASDIKLVDDQSASFVTGYVPTDFKVTELLI